MTHRTEQFSVATYENGTFTGYLNYLGRSSWTLSAAVRHAREFTEMHPGTTATVKAYFDQE